MSCIPSGSGPITMSNAAYHALPQFGSSQLKRILSSPAEARFGVISASRDTLARGTRWHSAILEPEIFDNFKVAPETNWRKTSDKDAYIDWAAGWGAKISSIDGKLKKEVIIESVEVEAERLGIGIVLPDELEEALWVSESVWKSTRARRLLTGSIREMSYIYGDYKARPDATNAAWLVDFKSRASVAQQDAEGFFERLKYAFSMACYEWVLARQNPPIPISQWGWIAVESKPYIVRDKKPEYRVKVWHPSTEMMEAARDEFTRAREIYEECLASGNWPEPAEPESTEIINRPAWATGRSDNHNFNEKVFEHVI